MHAGIKNMTFYPEPVAATLSYLHKERRHSSGRVLTLDFGGGTLALSVVEFSGVEFDVLSTAGMSLGARFLQPLQHRSFDVLELLVREELVVAYLAQFRDGLER